MFKKLMSITCEQATFLASKKEEHKTGFIENMQLKIHHSICDGCKLFAQQSGYIGDNAKRAAEFSDENLPEEKIEKIKKILV